MSFRLKDVVDGVIKKNLWGDKCADDWLALVDRAATSTGMSRRAVSTQERAALIKKVEQLQQDYDNTTDDTPFSTQERLLMLHYINEMKTTIDQSAATTIQSHIRGFLVKRRNSMELNADDAKKVEQWSKVKAKTLPTSKSNDQLEQERATLASTLQKYEAQFLKEKNRPVQFKEDLVPVMTEWNEYRKINREIKARTQAQEQLNQPEQRLPSQGLTIMNVLSSETS